MTFPYEGATDRLTALKRAAHGFLRTMKPGDQAMLITFSYDDDITLDVAVRRRRGDDLADLVDIQDDHGLAVGPQLGSGGPSEH